MAINRKNKKAIDSEINKALLDDFDKIESFVVGKWKYLIIGSIVLVVAVGIIYAAYVKRGSQIAHANNVLGSAVTATELNSALQQYGDYPGANAARLKLAEIYIGQGKYTEAAAEFNKIAQTTTAEDFKQRMMLDEAYMLEDNKALEQAVNAFAVIGNNGMLMSGIRAEAFYGAARLSVALKKTEDAKRYLSQLKNIQAENDAASGFWKELGRSLNSSN